MLHSNNTILKQIALPTSQIQNAINAPYYFHDLVSMDDLPAAGEGTIANIIMLQPENLLLLTDEIKEQILFICSQLGVPNESNIHTVFQDNSQILATDNKHIQQTTVGQAIMNYLNQHDQASYIMQHPECKEWQINHPAIQQNNFNILNLKQNLPTILQDSPFLIQQETYLDQETLLADLLHKKDQGVAKIVIKNPNIEGGFGVQLIPNLQNQDSHSLTKKIHKLGKSNIYTSEDFIEGTEYSSQFKVINGQIIAINNSLQIIDESSHIGNVLSNHITQPNDYLPQLIKIIEPYFSNFSGLFGIDYILTADNHLKVLEINPRFTGNSVGSNLVSLFTDNFLATTVYETIETTNIETFNSNILNKSSKLNNLLHTSHGMFPLQWSHVGNYGKIKWLLSAPNQLTLTSMLEEYLPNYDHKDQINNLLTNI